MKEEPPPQPEAALSKLARARKILRGHKLTKSGRNDFAHYNYFELGDFLPQSLDAFDEVGLTAAPICFTAEGAMLRIVDPETKEEIEVSSPMSTAELKGCHPVQNLGAVQTYLRRYLWSAAMELIEGDPLDGSKPLDGVSVPKVAPKTPPRGGQRQETASDAALRLPSAESTTWQGMIDWERSKPYQGKKKSGEPYTLYRVTLEGEPERTATTFSEEIYSDAKAFGGGVMDVVILRVTPNLKSTKPNTWELLKVLKVEEEEPTLEEEFEK